MNLSWDIIAAEFSQRSKNLPTSKKLFILIPFLIERLNYYILGRSKGGIFNETEDIHFFYEALQSTYCTYITTNRWDSIAVSLLCL